MALLLVYGRNNTHTDSVKDRRGCYKLGDIVQVLDEDAHDGNVVANPVAFPHILIRVSGITSEQVRHVMAPEVSSVSLDRKVITRRLFRFRLEDLPSQAKQRLQRDRYAEVTRAQAKQYLRNKVTTRDFEGEV